MPTQNRQRNVKVIDAEGQSLGRLAAEVATILMGKNKATYVPNVDGGDFVHVKNMSKAVFTGRKMDQKTYKWYTGYQGGLRENSMKNVWEKDPGEVLRAAVKNMLQKNTFQVPRLRRLRVTV